MFSLNRAKLLVIAPHPDDEVLGCGGLIQKVKAVNGKVYIQFLTNGATRDFSKKGKSSISERDKEIVRVMRFLKVDQYHLAFADNEYHLKMDKYGAALIMTLIERDSPLAIQKIKPDILVFPSLYAYNQDHQIAARAVHASLRSAEPSTKHFVPTVLAYEMPADEWSLSEKRAPNFFVPLTPKEIKLKLKAMSLYRSQMRVVPNPRALSVIKSWAHIRGALAGTEFAEAYHNYRMVL